MELPDYIAAVGAGVLAERLGCSKQLVSHWRVGRQRPSPRMARRIEIVSDGRVLAADLRPEEFSGMAVAGEKL